MSPFALARRLRQSGIRCGPRLKHNQADGRTGRGDEPLALLGVADNRCIQLGSAIKP